MATETKNSSKQILLRTQPKTYDLLLREAAAESVKRGAPLSVQKLVLEIVEDYLAKKRAKAPKTTKAP
ncbi:hypothetical protein ACPCHQ_22075 [Ralstonia thomasii]|uniref:hypothetical protein n=1 Tax=Ralstonia thomasii TaxID=3058596 RepID=UPI003C3041AA